MCITETETELNVEVAFSEQALTYRDDHQKLTASPNSPDDKLPVSHIPANTRTQGLYVHSLHQKAYFFTDTRSMSALVEEPVFSVVVIVKQDALI